MRRALVVVPLLLLASAPSAPARAEIPPPATPALVYSILGIRSEVRWLFPDTGQTKVVAQSDRHLVVSAFTSSESEERVFYTRIENPCADCSAGAVDSVALAGGKPRNERAAGRDLAVSDDGTTWA